MWTQFMDMHSGGGTKIKPYEYIYIEAPENEARVIFYNRFGRNPDQVTCTCCGSDYSLSEDEDLTQLTGYNRNCLWASFNSKGEEVSESRAWVPGKGLQKGYTQRYVEEIDPLRAAFAKYLTLDEYLAQKNILSIPAHEIKPEERVGTVPDEGYVWR